MAQFFQFPKPTWISRADGARVIVPAETIVQEGALTDDQKRVLDARGGADPFIDPPRNFRELLASRMLVALDFRKHFGA